MTSARLQRVRDNAQHVFRIAAARWGDAAAAIRRWIPSPGLVTLVVCACVWVFVTLADDAPEGDYLHLESRLMLALRQPGADGKGAGPEWLPHVARDVTALGSGSVVTLLVVLVVGFLWLQRSRRAALGIALATSLGYGMSEGLKRAFGRPRPDVALRLDVMPRLMVETNAAFPSGHSMLASVVYLTLAALLGEMIARRRREKVYLVAAAALVSVLVGVTRVYLGVHYPTDVLAGWAAGTAWAVLCWAVAAGIERRAEGRTAKA